MTQDLNAAVEDCRRRISDQAAEVKRCQSVVRDLEAQTQEAAPSRILKSLRRAQADLDAADALLIKLKRDYARFRLREALGDDPAAIETQVFDEELMAIAAGWLTRQDARDPWNGRISFETFRSLLLADLLLSQAIENERADRRADVIIDMLDEQTSTKTILRQWASLAQSDPHCLASGPLLQ